MMAKEVGAPEAQNGAATELTQPHAPEAEAPKGRGNGFEVAADGEAPTDDSKVVGQKIPPGTPAPGASAPDASPNAHPPEGRPSGPGQPA